MQEILPGRNINIRQLLPKDGLSKNSVFMFHGSMASQSQFDPIIERLFQSSDYNVYSFDALGCGKSDKPKESSLYAPQNMFLDVSTFFHAHATQKNVIIGHSYGTVQAVRLYNHWKSGASSEEYRNNCCINGLVLIGTGYEVTTRSPIFYLPTFVLAAIQSQLSQSFLSVALASNCSTQLREECFKACQSNEMHVCKSFYSQCDWLSASGDSHCRLSAVFSVICYDVFLKIINSVMSNKCIHIAEWAGLSGDGTALSVLEGGAIPLLMLHGDQDGVIPLAQAQKAFETLRALYPAPAELNVSSMLSLHVFRDASHQVHQESPDEVCAAIATFMSNTLL